MSKIFKVLILIFVTVITLISASAALFLSVTADTELDNAKLINYSTAVTVFDDDGKEISYSSLKGQKNAVQLKDLQKHTVNAFIASEDRKFYTHGGLNYKRILKAIVTNLSSASFKEGASTISQQLIKNTHLSGDKTIKRKLKEIKLTKQLEKSYSKDEILQMYLNTIYFGHNCYGIENAAQFYFNKRAEQLNLEQSAMLVGLLTSPNNLSPFKNAEKCKNKRNLVLKCMYDCNYIDEKTYGEQIKLPLSATKGNIENIFCDYLSQVLDELDEIGVNCYKLKDGGKIYTYLNCELQTKIEQMQYETDNAIVVKNTENGGINAYKSSIFGAKRQIGSTIKPLLVYAPAIEEKILIPSTKICDEKINFGGYSPENFDKKYRGYVSVSDSIKYSLNTPSVKTINALTLEKAEKYAKKLGIELEEGDKNLSLALGAMSHGINLQKLCEAYSAFPRGGSIIKNCFIKKIEDADGKVIYRNSENKNSVFSQSTCSLINDMLIKTTKEGTAKKLKNNDFDLASKTGTCGNSLGNTDAYAICYTSQNVIGVWLGDAKNQEKEIYGGNQCCKIAQEILNCLYKSPPEKLDRNSGTVNIKIDKREYEKNNKIVIADEIAPITSTLEIKCPKNNVPVEKSHNFSNPTIANPTIFYKNGQVSIILCQTVYYDYLIEKQENNKIITVYDGKWKNEICDSAESFDATYFVTPYYKHGDKKYLGNKIKLPKINTTSKDYEKLPNIAKKDWYKNE